jgi:predicted transcriptional regulator
LGTENLVTMVAADFSGSAYRRLVLIAGVSLIGLMTACVPRASNRGPEEQKAEGPVVVKNLGCEEAPGPLKLPTGAESPTGKTELLRIAPRTDRFCAIVLSIDPTFLGWLNAGDKSFEYRKSHPSDKVSHIIFFDNKALTLVAIADVVETVAGDPLEISELTWRRSGTTVDGLMSYFGDRPVGFATELKNFRALPNPISLAAARTIDPKFQRPYGYLFVDRHPKINDAIMAQLGITKQQTETTPEPL